MFPWRSFAESGIPKSRVPYLKVQQGNAGTSQRGLNLACSCVASCIASAFDDLLFIPQARPRESFRSIACILAIHDEVPRTRGPRALPWGVSVMGSNSPRTFISRSEQL